MGRTEIATSCYPVAKHTRGVDIVVADRISRWPADQVHNKINQIMGGWGCRCYDIGTGEKVIVEVVLQEPSPKQRLDYELLSAINNREN